MKVKDLIQELQKCEQEAEITNYIIMFQWFDKNGWGCNQTLSIEPFTYHVKDGGDD